MPDKWVTPGKIRRKHQGRMAYKKGATGGCCLIYAALALVMLGLVVSLALHAFL